MTTKFSSIKLKKVVSASLTLAVIFSVVPFSNLQTAQAAEIPLVISDVNTTVTDDTATVFWHTNRNASGKIQWGRESGEYLWTIIVPDQRGSQAVTLTGLQPKTKYYFKITAYTAIAEVEAFERSFETLEFGNNTAPVISEVRVAYLTGTTATIQWKTNEPTSAEVEYGLTEQFGSRVGSGGNRLSHDVTIRGLLPGALYHYRVLAKDKDNNTTRWQILTFRTFPTENAERDPLTINSVSPTSVNDINVGTGTAVISWRTNKLAEGTVRYGENNRFTNTVTTLSPRVFDPAVTLTNLKPNTTYIFEIEVRDVFGARVKSEGHSFTTKPTSVDTGLTEPSTPGTNAPVGGGQVLGSTFSCSINLATDFGYYGQYFNFDNNRSDVDFRSFVEVPNAKVARENGWYSPDYFSFEQIDSQLVFPSFFPLDEGLPGDPYHFAVYWRAVVDVPADGTYTFKAISDDDSWTFIDGEMIINLGGAHSTKTLSGSRQLTKGLHILEIFYADRGPGKAVFEFHPDTQLTYHPLPEGCSLQDVINSQGTGTATTGTTPDSGTGQVLGTNTDRPAPALPACSNDRGYTEITALYKTTNSPDVWALLATGQKHYITSPESFNEYGCRWEAVKTVSQQFLNRFDSANLVRTPANPTIYHLFQRLDRKWLKINIPSPTVFVSYLGNFWGNVARINQFDMDAYPPVRLIKTTDNPNVYLIDGHTKRLIPSAAAFSARNFEWFEIVEINDLHIESYETGPSID